MNYYIGIDIGGTEVKGGIVSEEGELIFRDSRRTNGKKEGTLRELKSIISHLSDQGFSIESIGIGTAGSVDLKKGSVTEISGNIEGWGHTQIREECKDLVSVPIYVENDGNVALLAEMTFGASQTGRNVVMLTLGTGLGAGFYIENQGIYHGSHFKSMELGHTILYPNGRKCFCGQLGCTEQYVSGSALTYNYEDFAGKTLSGEEIMERIKIDSFAKEGVEKFVRDLGTVLISVKNTFDPDMIVLGGGVIHSKESWWQYMETYFYNHVNSPDSIKIVPAKFLNDAGIIGAATLAMRSVDIE